MRLPEGKDWLYRPVQAGMCTYVQLTDGTLDIADLAEMNDVLDCEAENRARAHQAAQRRQG